MPVIRIGNYKPAPAYESSTNVEANRRLWRNDVRRALWQVIEQAKVPGLEERDSVTFAFDPEWEKAESDPSDPQIAFIFLEGFEARKDRPTEMRHALACSLGKALAVLLADGWSVEVMPKRYNSGREGAALVGLGEVVSGSCLSPLRYKFRILVFQGDQMVDEVETDVHEFGNTRELTTALVEFAAKNSAQKWHVNVQALWDRKMPSIRPPSITSGTHPSTTFIIKEVIKVD